MQYNGPMLERRRIEAEIIKPIYDELCVRFGTDIAREVVGEAVKKAAIAEGRAFAKKVGDRPGLDGLVKTSSQWREDNALESTIVEHSERRLVDHVTRCRYAEMYREMDLGELGFLLSCNRDEVYCKGFDDRIKLTRSQTIMQGAAYCDFTYELTDDENEEP